MNLNLPDTFEMADIGHYNHDGVKYICEPYMFRTIDKYGNTLDVIYNENYYPIALKMNGEDRNLQEYMDKNLIHYWVDPRYFLRHKKEEDLSHLGIDGKGYIVFSFQDDVAGSIIVCKINSEDKFTKHAIMLLHGEKKELPHQRWHFEIKEKLPTLDEVLDKINKVGMEGLSEIDKKVLSQF
jgi:hypothetical protein